MLDSVGPKLRLSKAVELVDRHLQSIRAAEKITQKDPSNLPFPKDKPWMIQLVAATCISLDEGPSPVDSRHLNRPQTCSTRTIAMTKKDLEAPVWDCVIGIPSYFTDLQ
ncbi:hypothetical protein KIW84_055633 [Lathyrus oleraceus]|uniref:Uncharacterized protein n=1 Tax=Pisum sativum TaxID=3888 RepID=A0A9D4WYD8_PEA|nr:hypothetical protein KIW84_055633 [Pisum sativum]